MNHIELLGVAGAGKTTTASEIFSNNTDIYTLKEMHSTVVSDRVFPSYSAQFEEKLPRLVFSYLSRITGLSDRGVNHFSLKYPEMLPKTAEYMHQYTDVESRIDSISSTILDLVETYGLVDSSSTASETVLIDEGFGSIAASIMYPPQYSQQYTEQDIREYVETMPVPDGIIFVRANPEVYEKRLLTRDGGAPHSWDCLEKDAYLDFATESDKVTACVADSFDQRGAEVLEVDTGQLSIDQSTAEIEQFISTVSS